MRRGRNEGSIFRRTDGRWCAVVQLGRDEHGRRVRKSLYGRTRREVADRLRTLHHAIDRGAPVTASDRLTVAGFLADWLEAARPTVRPRTFVSYEGIVRTHLVPTLGAIRLTRLSAADVQATLNAKHAGGLSARSVSHVRAVLRRALNVAIRRGLIERNPAALADPPRVRRYEFTPLSPAQVRAFLDAARDDRLFALWALALSTGMRQGELLGLRWEDVDLDAATLRVRTTLAKVPPALRGEEHAERGSRWTLSEPKSQSGRRTIALPPFAVAALRAHRSRQELDERIAGSRWTGNRLGLVFTSTIGTPLEARNVVARFHELLDAAGLPRIRFHDTRHSAASLMIALGAHPRTIMETLGHSQIALTMNTYAHVLPALQRDVADGMEVLIAGTSS